MAIQTKRPPIKETIGAQYICFNKMSADGEWTNQFEEEVEKTETVKSVKVTENSASSDVRASGKIYVSDNSTESVNVETEVIAFVQETLAKMKGEVVDKGGLVIAAGNDFRPYFAYGKVVKLKSGKIRMEWFPKCQLSENTDETKTSEASFSEQTDTITIKAYDFDGEGHCKTYVDSSMSNFPEGLTEEKFFSKPILTPADLAAVVGAAS